MNDNWVFSHVIIGDAATGVSYFRRNSINITFWREVKKGNHILFVAPRRVGKTSIMKDLVENCPEGYVGIYDDTESIRSREEFFQRLFELLIHSLDQSRLEKARTFLDRCIKKYAIKEITRTGIRIESREIDYEREVHDLLPAMKDAQVHSVIFLDEFAEILFKLKQNGKHQDAIEILYTLRAMRSNENFKNFTVVYAGSIGLETVVKSIDRPKLINDLHPIKVPPLTQDEARHLIEQVTEGATIHFSDEMIAYVCKKLEYLLPYYLCLMVAAIENIAYDKNEPEVDRTVIDEAFEKIIDERKNFEDWLERLKKYHSKHFAFINELLKQAAHEGSITVEAIYNKAKEYGRMEDYMDFVDMLCYDGYLTAMERRVYRFSSPLLRGFWLEKYPINYA